MMKQAVKFVFNRAGYRIKKIHPNHTTVSNKLIKCRIGNFDLWFDETHALPHYLQNLAHYATNVGRLGQCVHQKYSDMVMIDVGANVGDTVAICRTQAHYPIVCIEGDDRYFNILEKNAPTFTDLHLLKAYVGEKQEKISAQVHTHAGTTNLSQTEQGSSITINTLDHIVSSGIIPKCIKLLKVDTDGYDLKVLRGAGKLLEQDAPVLFIEYDRTLFEKEGEQGIDTLSWLHKIGYSDAVFYDNYGRFVTSVPLGSEQVYHLHNYIGAGAFQYFDIALFHKTDSDIAQSFTQNELAYFN